MIRDLYIKSYESDNTNNYIIASNNPCIKDSSGRRYYILEINTSKKHDYKYWDYMRNQVFNDEVGECIFNYFLDVKIPKGFNAQHKMPANSEKQDQIAKTLHSSYVFLKETFIRPKKGIMKAVRLSQFYDEYKEYCQHHSQKSCDKFDLVKRLTEVGLNKESKIIYKSSNIDVIKFTYYFAQYALPCHPLSQHTAVLGKHSPPPSRHPEERRRRDVGTQDKYVRSSN